MPPEWKTALSFILVFIQLPAICRLYGLVSGSGSKRTKSKSLNAFQTNLSTNSLWTWMFIGGLTFFFRFRDLTTLSTWPLLDEGLTGYFSSKLNEQWDWKLLIGFSQFPPLYIWAQSFVFKIFGVSLFSLWFLPAFLSTVTVFTSYFAIRQFSSKTFSRIYCLVLSICYWPIYLGRHSVPAVLLLFGVFLILFTLGWFWKSSATEDSITRAILLGICSGIGFYTYPAWIVVFAAVSAAVFYWFLKVKNKNGRYKSLLGFGITVFIVVLPLLAAFFREGLNGYFFNLLAIRSGNSFSNQLIVLVSYFQDIFWGGEVKTFHYGPVWGGFLNPILGALFFVGLISEWNNQIKFWVKILGGCTVLFMLPGILTNHLEALRVVQIIPLLIYFATVGIVSLLPTVKTWRIWIAFCLLVVSASLDSYHLFEKYRNTWENAPLFYGDHKSTAFEKAYRILSDKYRKDGPGFLFLDFISDPNDQTLSTASYSMNAVQGGKPDPEDVSWVALLTSIQFQPFLSKRFSDGSWYWISGDFKNFDGGYMLAIIPITNENRVVIKRWLKANQTAQWVTGRLLATRRENKNREKEIADTLLEHYSEFQGDPLLETYFWRCLAFRYEGEGNNELALDSIGKVVKSGYVTAKILDEYGQVLIRNGKMKEAEEAFNRSAKLMQNEAE